MGKWFREGHSMIRDFDRQQKELERKQSRRAEKWGRTHGKKASQDVNRAFRNFAAHSQPILKRLHNRTRKAQRFGEQMARKTERANRAAARAFEKEFNM